MLRERNMISLYRRLDEGHENCVGDMLTHIQNVNMTRKKSSKNEDVDNSLVIIQHLWPPHNEGCAAS